jgi:outer membrane immunogenic protein
VCKILIGAAIACIATSSVAADFPLPTETPIEATVATPFTWSGFLVGLHGGFGWGDFFIDNVAAPDYSFDFDSFIGGGQAGFDWQWNMLVLGIEADASWKGYEGDDGGFLGVTDSIDGNWGATVRGRVGLAFNRFLVFGTGGLAVLDYDYSSRIDPAGPTANFSDTDIGFTVGGGAGLAVTDHFSLEGQYLFSDFDENNRSSAIFPGAPWTTQIETHEVTLRGNYRF